jgi:hypothetical protein
LPKLTYCIFATISFDLWIFKEAHNIFVVIINILGFDEQPKCMPIGLFVATKTINQTLVNNLI